MPTKRPPKDTNELAKYILDASMGGADKIEPAKKNPAAVALSALGASKGGKARAKKLSSKRRAAIAKTAAKARWSKGKKAR
jgi:hypothetical protein